MDLGWAGLGWAGLPHNLQRVGTQFRPGSNFVRNQPAVPGTLGTFSLNQSPTLGLGHSVVPPPPIALISSSTRHRHRQIRTHQHVMPQATLADLVALPTILPPPRSTLGRLVWCNSASQSSGLLIHLTTLSAAWQLRARLARFLSNNTARP